MEVTNSRRFLRYADADGDPGYSLFEMSEEMLKELMEAGSFTIKGSENEEAVLCTTTSCFSIREAPSSNSMLLMQSNPLNADPNKPTTDVLKTLNGFYILNRTALNMERLKTMLKEWPLGIDELDDVSGEMGGAIDASKLCTYEQLEESMQCSTHELKQALRKIEAFSFEGRLRVLSPELELMIAKHVVLSAQADGLYIDRMRMSDVMRTSKDGNFSATLIDHIASIYFDSAANSDENDTILTFNMKKFNALLARTILNKQPNGWLLSTLTSAMRKSVPEGFVVSDSDLEGLVAMEESGKTDFKLTLLPSDTLSHNPKIRLAKLFSIKPKWTFAQIKPYLQDLLTHDADESKILVQHTRSTNMPDGSKLYSSR